MWEKEMKTACNAAMEAGRILKKLYGNISIISKKGEIDLVTEADVASEKAVIDVITRSFPDDMILSEEAGKQGEVSDRVWIIDPLDGTTNFAHMFPFFAVSIAFQVKEETVVGVVYNPVMDEFFEAKKGKGAFLNKKSIKVSDKVNLKDSLIGTGFPYDVYEKPDEVLDYFKRMIVRVQGIRRGGAAAIDLCYLAAGRLDGFWEQGLKPWDTAAGTIILKEAGGVISDYSGNSYNPFMITILASTPGIYTKMLEVFNNYKAYSEKREIIHKQPVLENKSINNFISTEINKKSDSASKIRLFMSLFKGRDDIYATKWENKKKVTSGYSPVCLNQWRKGICGKPKIPCSKCENKSYAVLDEDVIDDHLRGNIVVGIYPMLPDETCNFLAMDFDDDGWQRDVSIIRETCDAFHIPVAVERSRSGNGAHIWFFFEYPIPASLARKLGAGLLTFSMNRRHELKFKSYDRLFPSQDTLPKGGFGNLIALPFQKSARKNQNSEFVDENFYPYTDQWAYLSTIRKISEDKIGGLIAELCQGHELGLLKIDEEEDQKPWETVKKVILDKKDYPRTIDIVKSNMLFIPKNGISEKGLNHLKRLASFKNPMFYKQQAMRLSTYGHSRIISCADETRDYLCLPRGCEEELVAEFQSLKVDCQFIDKTNHGKKIDVEFNGELRDEQSFALDQLLFHDIGILSGTTAFGKTVVAIKLIAERKINTLILVDRVGLLNQWIDRLKQFLVINEALPEVDSSTTKKRGRKKKTGIIGQLGARKNSLNGVVDIAVVQSMGRMGEVKDCIKNYGMIIADECHHASAVNYENVLKTANARYVYGLTATPTRKDGHHPILLMQCGPILYRDDPKKQAESRPFDHFVIPRFTSLRILFERNEKEFSINDVYSEIIENDFRDQQIIKDVVENYKLGRNCVVLSQRVEHVEMLSEKLKEEIPDILSLTGRMGLIKAREVLEYIKNMPEEKNITLVATGPYIGEGFDEPRLDTLFLVMPISWKGTLQQYAGRLHRLSENKKEVLIYDYVDIHVKMLEKMYQRRLNGYASMGYKVKGEGIEPSLLNIIFNRDNFLPVFSNDIVGAKKEILIVSPFVKKNRISQMIQHIEVALLNKVRVIVITRPVEDFKEKDKKAVNNALDLLESKGIKVVFKPDIHQKFAIIDQNVVWYGSINLLSFGNSQESIMRIESGNIANELIKSIEDQ